MTESPMAMFVDRYTMRHVRDLRHPVDRVWRAITTPDELSQWMTFPVTGELRLGGRWMWGAPDAPHFETEVTVLEPPRVLELRDVGVQGYPVGGFIRFELEAAAGGTRLTFVQHVPGGPHRPVDGDLGGDLPGGGDTGWRPGFVGGWHLFLDGLGYLLDGRDALDGMEPADVRFGRLVDEWLGRKVDNGELTSDIAARYARELRGVAVWDDFNVRYREHIRRTIPSDS